MALGEVALAALIDFVSGTIGGMSGKVVEFPFDTLKVKLQTQTPGQYRGSWDCLQQTLKKEGPRGIYRGLSSPLLGAMAENAVVFAAYGQTKKLASGFFQSEKTPYGQSPLPACYFAGGVAGLFVAIVLTPVELIKCRLQTQGTSNRYKGPIDCLVKIRREEGGFRGLYQGHSSTTMREGVGCLFWFGIYETVLRLLTPEGKKKEELSPIYFMASGSAGGIMYWAVPYPIDVVKSVIQTMSPETARMIAQRDGQPTFLQVLRHVISTKGLSGLYTGFSLTLFRAIPANAAIFGAFELSSKFLSSVLVS